jgi:hypothetical protein
MKVLHSESEKNCAQLAAVWKWGGLRPWGHLGQAEYNVAKRAQEQRAVKILDPGHRYWLDMLDTGTDQRQGTEMLTFVKREGSRYPGNRSHYPGTNCQEVIRALIDRVKHLDHQVPDPHNQPILHHLRETLWLFEERAAQRYGRVLPPLADFACIEQEPTCAGCAHIRCGGECGRRENDNRALLSSV